MSLFSNSFNAGVQGGGTLAQLFQKTRDRKTLQSLADQFGQSQDYNALGTGLIGLGQTGQGINAMNVPYQRDQNELQREFQNQQFQALNLHRDRTFNNQVQQQGFQNDLASQRLSLAEQQAQRQAEGGGNFTTPFQATDENGNQVFVQANDRGEIKPVEGFAPNNSLTKVDAGDKTLLLDRAGNVVATTNKNSFTPARDKAAGTATGKAQIEKQFDFPRVAEQANEAIGVIDGILSDPALDDSIGNIDSRVPDLLAGQKVVDFRTKVAQLEGKTFLQAFQSLKGGGQITEAEGRKATAAIARLNQAQSEDAFRSALIELKSVIETAKNRAQKSAKAPRLPSGTSNGVSFSRDSRVTPASGDVTPVDDNELNELLGKY